MTILLVCGLLLFSPAEGPAATLPPTETSDFLDAIDLSAWDDFFSRLEETEPWQRPSELVRAFAEGEDDPAQLIAWLKARGAGRPHRHGIAVAPDFGHRSAGGPL